MASRVCTGAVVVTWLAATLPPATAADGELTLEADVNGDHVPDSVSLVCLGDGGAIGTKQYVVRVVVSGATRASKAFEALGPIRVDPKLPDPLQALQELPEGPLAVADLDDDGRKEIIARMALPMSRTNVLALVFRYDPGVAELDTCFDDGGSDGLLCMTADEAGRRLLIPWYLMPNGCPAFPNVFVADDGRWAALPGARLPARLAAPLALLYESHNQGFELRADTWLASELVRSLLASGNVERASSVTEDALGGLDEAEADILRARREALILRGRVRCAMGQITEETVGAIQAFEDAFDIEPAPGFETARGFALVEVCKTCLAAGDWEGANVWLTRAEEAEGQPGKFAKLRETIPLQ